MDCFGCTYDYYAGVRPDLGKYIWRNVDNRHQQPGEFYKPPDYDAHRGCSRLAAAGVETCLGSASAGLSVMGGGLTFGSTMVDSGCTIRLLAWQLFAFGFQKAALALMCQDERVAAAMDAAGSPCPASAAVRISGRIPFAPVNGFAQEDQVQPFTQDAQTQPFTQDEQATPIAQEEQALFDRASNMH